MPLDHACLRKAAQEVIIAWANSRTKTDMTEAISRLRVAVDDPLWLLRQKFWGPVPPWDDTRPNPVHMTPLITTNYYHDLTNTGGNRWRMEVVRTDHADAAAMHAALSGIFMGADQIGLDATMPILPTGQRAARHSMLWFARATPICWVRMTLERGKWP